MAKHFGFQLHAEQNETGDTVFKIRGQYSYGDESGDKVILELINILKDSKKIRYKQDFYEEIGLLKQNVSLIKNQSNMKMN